MTIPAETGPTARLPRIGENVSRFLAGDISSSDYLDGHSLSRSIADLERSNKDAVAVQAHRDGKFLRVLRFAVVIVFTGIAVTFGVGSDFSELIFSLLAGAVAYAGLAILPGGSIYNFSPGLRETARLFLEKPLRNPGGTLSSWACRSC